MSVTFDFSGRVVIVTGAARGIGRVMAQRFAASGASVFAADRDEQGLADTCMDLDPERVASLVADVSNDEGAASIVDSAVERFGKLDICVNNAAVAPHASIFDERAEVWDTIYAVNTRGTFLMTRTAARSMLSGRSWSR